VSVLQEAALEGAMIWLDWLCLVGIVLLLLAASLD
jgi:hypothetical protein